MSVNPRIIIIGAGAAGYAAACKLLESGFANIQVLEAENRTGGRVHSVEFGAGIVDMGAQWCHGESGNIVYGMVKDLNLLQPSSVNYAQFRFVNAQGNFVDTSVADKLIELLATISDDSEEMRKQNCSFGEYVTTRYNEIVNAEYTDIDEKITKSVLDWFHKFENSLNGSKNWFEVSAKGYCDYQYSEGDMTLNWKDKGYQTIFSVLKKALPDPTKTLPIDEKILLNKEVERIIWDDLNAGNREVIVECSDGTKYTADHVICTVSLAVLKATHKRMFTPELPLYKTNAIHGLSIDTVDKIFLKFPTKWWPDDCVGFSFIWSGNESNMVLQGFPEGRLPNGKSWLESVFGFYPIDNNPNVLMGWVTGELVPDIEALSDDVVQRGCMHLLKTFVGKHYTISDPESILRSGWHTNKHFRGSYSYRSLESDRLNINAADLAQPLGNNAVLFAGEATHSSFYSTVHGAVETGYREAQRIITQYNKHPSSSVRRCAVAIVGAGMAGLAAAVTLTQAGCTDILLLEAQHEPGGRIQTIKMADGYVDLGAQWLHGDQNALWQVSNAHNLFASKTVYEGRGLFLREDGRKINDFTVEKVGFIIGQILEQCEEFVNSPVIPDSVGKYLDEKFGEYLKTSALSEDEVRLYLELYDWHVRFQVIDNCCDNLYNVSAKFWGRYFCPTSNGQAHINYAKGHGSIVATLVEKLPENVLVTKCPVTNIDWSMTDTSVVKLTCQNASEIHADAVIVTCSLGVLKNMASTLFTPALPTAMTDIVNAMGFAGICKIFLLFESSWWGDTEGFQLIWNYDSVYADDWTRYLSGFDPVLDQPRMLLGWIGGRGAELVERVSEEEIGQKCTEILKKFTRNEKITRPVKVVRSTWTTNPWILGGYSHTTPRCDSCVLLPETLQVPVRDARGVARVLLAGEHTHAEHFSTTHGAYESGIQQAHILLAEDIASSVNSITKQLSNSKLL